MRILPTISAFLGLWIVLPASSPLWGVAPPSLQQRIDALPAGFTLKLEPGIYRGPIMIEKALVLDGQGEAVIASKDSQERAGLARGGPSSPATTLRRGPAWLGEGGHHQQ